MISYTDTQQYTYPLIIQSCVHSTVRLKCHLSCSGARAKFTKCNNEQCVLHNATEGYEPTECTISSNIKYDNLQNK